MRFFGILCGIVLSVFIPSFVSADCSYNNIEEIVQRYSKAVVRVERHNADPSQGDEFGSGVFYTPRRIVTNAHVVGTFPSSIDEFRHVYTDADLIGNSWWVHFQGTMYEASLIGRDIVFDLAILETKHPLDGVEPASFGDAVHLSVGHRVLLIGSPQRLDNTVTEGIISARNRHPFWGLEYHDDIQFDAATNNGNSGGPLVSACDGSVLAIVHGIEKESKGIAFGIPINLFRSIESSIQGTVQRGWLGIKTPEDVTALSAPGFRGLLETYRMTNQNDVTTLGFMREEILTRGGVFISEIMPLVDCSYSPLCGGETITPAFQAHLSIGDIVKRFNGKQVKTAQELLYEVVMSEPFKQGVISVVRFENGERKEIDMMITPMVRNPEGVMAGFY